MGTPENYWTTPQAMRERVLQLAHNRDETPEKVVERAKKYEEYVKGENNGEA